jgi:hypothetical protein
MDAFLQTAAGSLTLPDNKDRILYSQSRSLDREPQNKSLSP